MADAKNSGETLADVKAEIELLTAVRLRDRLRRQAATEAERVREERAAEGI